MIARLTGAENGAPMLVNLDRANCVMEQVDPTTGPYTAIYMSATTFKVKETIAQIVGMMDAS
jgi:hypothetical protein